jgi:hypothetical protein
MDAATMVNLHKLVIILELAAPQVGNQPTLVLLLVVQVQAEIMELVAEQQFQGKVILVELAVLLQVKVVGAVALVRQEVPQAVAAVEMAVLV